MSEELCNIDVFDGDTEVRIALSGQVDASNCDAVEQALVRDAGAPARAVALDLRGVSFMDSSALRALILADRSLQAAGGRLRVTGGSPTVLRLLEITGLRAYLGPPT